MVDLKCADELHQTLASIVDYPLYSDAPRVTLSATLAVSALQFGAAVRVLCGEGLVLGAGAALRSQFEAVVRSVWALHAATDGQVETLSADLTQESQHSAKSMPMLSEMLGKLEATPQLKNLLVSLHEFKTSSMAPLNSFVHSGIHTVQWTRHAPPTQLMDIVFRASNGLSVIAFQGIGILTGHQETQSQIIAATSGFTSVLPARRVST